MEARLRLQADAVVMRASFSRLFWCPRVGQEREPSLELGSAVLEVADQHQRFAEVVWVLEHEAGPIGGDLQ